MASITSVVFNDANANGIFDPDEGPYLDGPVTVNLYPASNPDGAPVASASTSPSADGSYTLPEVPPGNYVIEFVPGNGGGPLTFSPQDRGNDDARDSDVDPATGRASLTVTSGEPVTDVTAGVTTLPKIGPNVIFQDDDGDGIQDEGEPPMVGVEVVLYDSQGNQAGDPAGTDANGNYLFSGGTPAAAAPAIPGGPRRRRRGRRCRRPPPCVDASAPARSRDRCRRCPPRTRCAPSGRRDGPLPSRAGRC